MADGESGKRREKAPLIGGIERIRAGERKKETNEEAGQGGKRKKRERAADQEPFPSTRFETVTRFREPVLGAIFRQDFVYFWAFFSPPPP